MEVKLLKACVALLLSLSVTSCDFVRKVAGRPVSTEVEALRQQKLAESRARIDAAARDAAEKDYARKVEDAAVELEKMSVDIKRRGDIRTGIRTELSHRFYVILGAFGVESNALKLCDAVKEAGYDATVIVIGNGNRMVSAVAGDNALSLLDCLQKLSVEEFYPVGAWILLNE